MAYDDMAMIVNYDDPENVTHVDILNNFLRAQDFRFFTQNSSCSHLTMTGNFLTMFTFNPNSTTRLSSGGTITARLPVFGHDYIFLSSNNRSKALSAKCGERLQKTN